MPAGAPGAKSACGHSVTFHPVTKLGGSQEGKWQVRVRGPIVAQANKSGCKCIYSEPNHEDAIRKAARYLKIDPAVFQFDATAPAFCSNAFGAASTLGKRPAHHLGWPTAGDNILGSPVDFRGVAAAYQASTRFPVGVRLSVPGHAIKVVGSGSGAVFFRGSSASVAPTVLEPLGNPSNEQAAVIDLVVCQRRSVFITGSAGTGKSFVLKHIRKGTTPLLPWPSTQRACILMCELPQDCLQSCRRARCMSRHPLVLQQSTSAVAPFTPLRGLALVKARTKVLSSAASTTQRRLRDGSTHSASSSTRFLWFRQTCLSCCHQLPKRAAGAAQSNGHTPRYLQSDSHAGMKVSYTAITIRCLLEQQYLHEINLSRPTFTLLTRLNKNASCCWNRCSAPFGGLQLVLCGDFFQLGPVNPWRANGKEFAFEADAWATTVEHHVCLRTVVRQQGDASFVRVLEEIRWGMCSTSTHHGSNWCILPSICTPLSCSDTRVLLIVLTL